AQQDKRQAKSASTEAGEFVRKEMHHVREGKHGVRSTKQAIAIGLSKARRAGVELPPSPSTSPEVREKAERDEERGERGEQPSPKRARATRGALKQEGRSGASHRALSRQA